MARLGKPSTVLTLSAPQEEEGNPFLFASLLMKETHPALAFTSAFALALQNPILTTEEGGLICSACLHLGKAVVTLPVAKGKERGLNASLLLPELSLNYLLTIRYSWCKCVFFIKY